MSHPRYRIWLACSALASWCCSAHTEPDAAADVAEEVASDVGEDTRIPDVAREFDSSADALDAPDTEGDAPDGPSDGWQFIAGERCRFQRAIEPADAYRIEWASCPDELACRVQVLDDRYSGDILPTQMGQRLPRTRPVIGFRTFEEGRPLGDTQTIMVVSDLDGPPHLVWRSPRQSEVGAICLVGRAGSNGEYAGIELYYPDNTSDFYHAALNELNEMDTPIAHFEPGDQLGSGAQRLTVSSTHVLAKMSSLVWVMNEEGMVRRGGRRDSAGAPHAFGIGTSILGDRIIGGLDGWYVATFDTIDGPPTYLHERTTLRSTIYATTGDGEHIVWVQQTPDAPLELWASPFATTPEDMDAQVVAELETFRLPILGDGHAAILEDPNVLVVNLETGLRTTLPPPEGHVFWTDIAAVSSDELVAVVSRRGERRARYIRYDLRRATFE